MHCSGSRRENIGLINLDFDEHGGLIGIEVLAASSKLPDTCSSPRSGWTPTPHEAVKHGDHATRHALPQDGKG